MKRNEKPSFKIINQNTPTKDAQVGGMNIRLLASGDGVEVMLHKMKANSQWTLLQETSSGEFQYYFLINGEIHWQSEHDSGAIHAGESIALNAASEALEITAIKDSEFLFFCSTPLFQRHVVGIRDLEQLAVSIEQKDGYTAGHCSRIQRLSMVVAGVLEFTPKDKFDLRLGAFLHDVGKVRIPSEILNKAGPLTAKEWRIMKLHPVFGRDMVMDLNQYCLTGACKVIEHHHERYNGSGYPYGLWKREIHNGANIVAVVDAFDAMTTDRVYRKARSVDEAIHELKQNREILFHPDVVDAFMSIDLREMMAEHFVRKTEI